MGNSLGNNKYANTTNKSNINNSNKMNYPNKINNSGNLVNPKPNIENGNSSNNIANDNIRNININNNCPHKLGQKPNNIKTFEKNLKKKAEEEENKKKEKKLKRDLNNKNINYNNINKNINDNYLMIGKNYDINNYDNKIDKNKIDNDKDKNKIDDDKDKDKNKIDKLDLEKNEDIQKNIIIDDSTDNLVDNLIYSDNYTEYDHLNNFFEDNDTRQPLPRTIDCLTWSQNDNEEFENFKKKILSDDSIDNNMKQIIIQSRIEFIKNHEKKIQQNTEKILRLGIITPLKIKLKDKNFNKISFVNKENIILLIDNWIDMKVEYIKINSEQLYQLYELIDLMENEKKISDTQKIKNIFIPTNPDEFIELVEMMESVKTQSILEEKYRVERELETKRIEDEKKIKQEELEKIKLQEIVIRNEKIKLLLFNLNKMIGFDCEIKNLKDSLNVPIEKYCNLENELIVMDEKLYNNTIKFINSIRINKQDKESIIKLCKCL